MSNHIQICTSVTEEQKMKLQLGLLSFFCCVVLMSPHEVCYSMSEDASLLDVIAFFFECLVVVHFYTDENIRIIHWWPF